MEKEELTRSVLEVIGPEKQLPVASLYFAHNEVTTDYYIGASNRKPGVRVVEHLRGLKAGNHANPRFQKAFEESPEFQWECFPITTPEKAFIAERELLTKHRDDTHCLNIRGGSGYNEEVIAKRAASNRGKKHTEETKAVIREASILFWSDPQQRELQSEKRKLYFQSHTPYQLGIKRDEEYNQKVQQGVAKYRETLTKEQKLELNKKRAEGMKKPVLVGDKLYPSRQAAAVGEGISSPTVKDRIQSQNFPDWRWGS